jgi:hypothetical protein
MDGFAAYVPYDTTVNCTPQHQFHASLRPMTIESRMPESEVWNKLTHIRPYRLLFNTISPQL